MNTPEKRQCLIRRLAFSLLMFVFATFFFFRLHFPGYLGVIIFAPILAGGGLSLYILFRTLLGTTGTGGDTLTASKQRRNRRLFVVGALLGAVLTLLAFVATFGRIG
jgi:hypothetical protein